MGAGLDLLYAALNLVERHIRCTKVKPVPIPFVAALRNVYGSKPFALPLLWHPLAEFRGLQLSGLGVRNAAAFCFAACERACAATHGSMSGPVTRQFGVVDHQSGWARSKPSQKARVLRSMILSDTLRSVHLRLPEQQRQILLSWR